MISSRQKNPLGVAVIIKSTIRGYLERYNRHKTRALHLVFTFGKSKNHIIGHYHMVEASDSAHIFRNIRNLTHRQSIINTWNWKAIIPDEPLSQGIDCIAVKNI
jgi:hypothetical protein